MHCPTHGDIAETLLLAHILQHLIALEDTVTSNQQHLDTDIDGIKTAIATVITELKAQAASGQPLDFTNADALLASVQAEATADATTQPAPTTGDGNTPPTAS